MEKKDIFIAVAIAGVFYIAGQYIASLPTKEATNKSVISVQGTGKVETKPDVAQISLGVQTGTQATAEAATNTLSQKFEAVDKALKAAGVAAADIKTTNLSVNPVYDYPNGQQKLTGFAANETVEVKIRNLEKVGEIVQQATSQGANQAGGISFRVDKPEDARSEAQAKAIADARQKAQKLAGDLGARLGKIQNFSSSFDTPGMPQPMMYDKAMGGSLEAANFPVESGSSDITASVSIVYELK